LSFLLLRLLEIDPINELIKSEGQLVFSQKFFKQVQGGRKYSAQHITGDDICFWYRS